MNIFFKIISNPKVFVYTLIWLMLLVFFGTIAQRDVGLYASQMKYFSSYYFVVADLITFPGGRLTLMFMTLNLASSLFNKKRLKMTRL